MRKYILILSVTGLLFLVFLTIFLIVDSKKIIPDEDILSIISTIKYRLSNTLDTIDKYPIIINSYPYDYIEDASDEFLKKINDLLFKLKKTESSISEVSILERDNSIIFSVPGFINYRKYNMQVYNNIYEIKISEKFVFFIRNIVNYNDKVIAKLVITYYKDKFFMEHNTGKYLNIELYSNTINNIPVFFDDQTIDIVRINKSSEENYLKTNIENDKISIYYVNNDIVLYVYRVSDSYIFGYIRKPIIKKVADMLYIVVIINGFLLVMAIILVLMNLNIREKSKQLETLKNRVKEKFYKSF